MDLHTFDDTIVALSTPPGQSGIGIVRITGPEAIAIAEDVFVPAGATRRPSQLQSFTTAYGRVVDGERTVDEVILTVMRAPKTYTTQDVVEINCHGGIVPLRRTLELVLAQGARLADPGEFTKRAFYFGRIDLAQAEAVGDLINARTVEAQAAAMDQLEGKFSQQVNGLRDSLVDLTASLEAALDFGEMDIEMMSKATILNACDGIAAQLTTLIDSAEVGRVLREGVKTAIVGRPNVGKSSLMNALLGHDRAIVTPIPGTTRDVVEDTINVGGAMLLLADTAGLRESQDVVEAEGIQRTQAAMQRAHLVLLVMDGSAPLGEEDVALMGTVPRDKTILVINKDDLPAGFEEQALAAWGDRAAVRISAKLGSGIDELKEVISRTIWGGGAGPGSSTLVTNVRHKVALERTRDHVIAARGAAEEGLTEEYIASDLREALDALGEIVGVTLAEDIIDRIFENFCIGK